MLEKIEDKVFERVITSPERLFSRSPFSIVTMVARIKGQISEDMLRAAVAKAQQRHTLLRVRIIDETDHEQRFTATGVQEIPIEVVPRNSEDDWIKVHSEAAKDPYEFDSYPAIRFILLQSPDVSDLIILCHHIICDGMSLAYLARDLMRYLGDPSRDVDKLPDLLPLSLKNLPGDVSQSGIAKFFINRMNRQWAEEGEYFDNEDYQFLTKAYWENFDHGIISIELSEVETSALVARCRQEKVTVNSAITTAFGGAQSFVEGEKPYHSTYVIAANLCDRLPNSPGDGDGDVCLGTRPEF